jgi:hypothetical protein
MGVDHSLGQAQGSGTKDSLGGGIRVMSYPSRLSSGARSGELRVVAPSLYRVLYLACTGPRSGSITATSTIVVRQRPDPHSVGRSSLASD